jgi:hypothetical protein
MILLILVSVTASEYAPASVFQNSALWIQIFMGIVL